MKSIDRIFLGSGMVIPFWLFFGVLLTALAYPGYSHLDQAMSLLGAEGAPTQGFSAWVNNAPLGVLFVLFALGVGRHFRTSRLAQFSAGLILMHGLASFATGYYPCDQGCAPAEPSFAQQRHNLAGLVMFASLTVASAIWVVLGKHLLGSPRFSVFSAVCTVMALVTVLLMASALEAGQLFGLFQRLNYGVSVLWTAGLAWVSLRHADGASEH